MNSEKSADIVSGRSLVTRESVKKQGGREKPAEDPKLKVGPEITMKKQFSGEGPLSEKRLPRQRGN